MDWYVCLLVEEQGELVVHPWHLIAQQFLTLLDDVRVIYVGERGGFGVDGGE